MPLWVESFIVGLTAVIMLTGLLGLIIPIFPGNVVIWLAALIFGLVTGFDTLGWWMFALITLLMLIATTIDNVLMGAKAHANGATWIAIVLAMLGGIAGSFLFPPLGGLIASPLILFGMEYWRNKDAKQTFRIIKGMIFGWGMAFLARFSLGVVMIALWIIWAFS